MTGSANMNGDKTMQPTQILFYVDDKAKSGAFYSAILDREFADLSPFFGVIPLDGGWHLALLQRDGVDDGGTPSGGSELIFVQDSREKVDEVAKDWTGRGVKLLGGPVEARFGYSFLAVDPDGNRLRVGYFPQG